MKDSFSKIVEIGCGEGNTLNYLSKGLNSEAYGVEPSNEAVDVIKRKYKDIIIKSEFSDSLSFKNEEFDLVHLGFFMYLVDRELYLKTISEIDRILKYGGFLSIIDFDTPYPYSNNYQHKKGVYSHKIDNSRVFISTGLYTIINKYSYSHKKLSFEKNIDDRLSLYLLHKEDTFFKGIKE